MDTRAIVKLLEETGKDKFVKFVADKGKNSCDKCLQHHGKIFNSDDPNKPQLPIHPNCRCKYEEVKDSMSDSNAKIEQSHIAHALKEKHKLQEEEAKELASQVTKARNENSKLREQRLFLIFNGRYLMSSDGKFLQNAVSGKPIEKDISNNSIAETDSTDKTEEQEFDYSYSRQGMKDTGGIPQGLYYIEAKEERSAITSPWSHVVRKKGWGDYSWSLHPVTNTNVRERSGFFIHGGSVFGSAGCIDLQKNDKVFKKFFDLTNLSSLYIYVRYDKIKIKFSTK